MTQPGSPDDMVKTAVVINRRQQEALRAAAVEEDRSVSWFIRKALDQWFGFDKAIAGPVVEEKQEVA
jgi:hypothetical protein